MPQPLGIVVDRFCLSMPNYNKKEKAIGSLVKQGTRTAKINGQKLKWDAWHTAFLALLSHDTKQGIHPEALELILSFLRRGADVNAQFGFEEDQKLPASDIFKGTLHGNDVPAAVEILTLLETEQRTKPRMCFFLQPLSSSSRKESRERDLKRMWKAWGA
jgi:hypothetical protein